jgi:hypothetical protein
LVRAGPSAPVNALTPQRKSPLLCLPPKLVPFPYLCQLLVYLHNNAFL